MKTLFSIIVSLLIAASSIALAMHAQDQDPLCSAPDHEGFTYPQGQTPPENSSPENLPPNMHSAGIYQEDFKCDESDNDCHWVYKPAEENEPAKWELCKGDIRVITN